MNKFLSLLLYRTSEASWLLVDVLSYTRNSSTRETWTISLCNKILSLTNMVISLYIEHISEKHDYHLGGSLMIFENQILAKIEYYNR